VLTANDFIMMRPGNGISPMKFNGIIGKKLTSNIACFQQLQLDNLS